MSGGGFRFGSRPTTRAGRRAAIDSVFQSVASRYDVMNDIMSAGLHRLWKRRLVWQAAPQAGEAWLDMAAGSGDIAALLVDAGAGQVVAADPSQAMLDQAAGRHAGVAARLEFARCHAEQLPFPDASFAGVTCAFGLRNFTDCHAGLAELARVLQPGGRLLVLEFSRPAAALAPLHRRYLRDGLPALGACVAGDAASYRYLAESILAFPGQREVAGWLERAGLELVDWSNVAGGIAAIHRGWQVR